MGGNSNCDRNSLIKHAKLIMRNFDCNNNQILVGRCNLFGKRLPKGAKIRLHLDKRYDNNKVRIANRNFSKDYLNCTFEDHAVKRHKEVSRMNLSKNPRH